MDEQIRTSTEEQAGGCNLTMRCMYVVWFGGAQILKTSEDTCLPSSVFLVYA